MENNHLIVSISQKALIELNGKLLLVHGKEEWWEFPGGRVNEDETSLEEALKREIKEELGLDIEIKKIFTTYLFKNRYGEYLLALVYKCNLISPLDQIKPQESEIGCWKLFSEDELKDLKQVSRNTLEGLNKYFSTIINHKRSYNLSNLPDAHNHK